jgi:hypothetical protein
MPNGATGDEIGEATGAAIGATGMVDGSKGDTPEPIEPSFVFVCDNVKSGVGTTEGYSCPPIPQVRGLKMLLFDSSSTL